MTAPFTASRFRTVAMAVVVALAALVVTAGPAAAAQTPSCAEQVVADWYDNGRVDYLYPLHCYRDAIKSLPPDVKDYSSAKEEIERALQDAANRPPVTKPTPLTGTSTNPAETTGDDTTGGQTVAGGSNDNGPDTAGPSSVPIPLIVLGGLSVLLLAAGSAGYLARRFGSGDDTDAGDPPPAV